MARLQRTVSCKESWKIARGIPRSVESVADVNRMSGMRVEIIALYLLRWSHALWATLSKVGDGDTAESIIVSGCPANDFDDSVTWIATDDVLS